MGEELIKIMDRLDDELRAEGCYLDLVELMELAQQEYYAGATK